MRKLDPHPLSELFPPMTDEEYVGLRGDIEKHRLHEPIVLFEGRILDGRHRYRACCELGLDPECANFEDRERGVSALDWVVAANLHRRHLNESQRAVLAANREGFETVVVRPRFVTFFDDDNPDVMRGFIQPYAYPFTDNNGFVILKPGTPFPLLDPIKPLPAVCDPTVFDPTQPHCFGTLHFVIRRTPSH